MLEERPPISNISHREMPTYRKHIEHCRDIGHDAWYFIADDLDLIGNIYLTPRNELGVHVLEGWTSRGAASWAIWEVIRRHPRPYYLANVAPENTGSQNLFLRQGFEKVQHTYRYDP